MKQFEHGGNHAHDILDFSANINPLGMPEAVKQTLIENIERCTDYPDTECRALTYKLSRYENAPAENIVCGNGAADLIYRIVYAVKPKRGIVIAPTFSEYEKALSEIGCKIKYYNLKESENFQITESILDELHDADIFFLCSPNNPTGMEVKPELMDKITEKCLEEKILLVIDESFSGFSVDKTDIRRNEYTVSIKAFTKLYAMAGLRLGYMVCGSKSAAEKVRNIGQCWSVSVPAQLAGIAALEQSEYLKKTVTLITQERKYLSDSLSELGFKVYPSQVNFLLFRCDKPLDGLLMKEKIAIRSCENYRGLDKNFFRIAVKNHCDNMKLVKAIEKITGV